MDNFTSRQKLDATEFLRAHDASGRDLIVRRLSALDRLRIFKAIGPTLADNPPYLGMAMLAYSVCEIEGVPVPSPVNEPQFEALVQRLGDDGMNAIAEAFEAITAPPLTEAGVGNSVGTPI
jgi:hypothetical protein